MQKLQSVCFIALSRISFCLDINGLQSGHKELVNKSFNRKTRVAVFQRDGFVSVPVAGEFNVSHLPYKCRKLRTFPVYVKVSYISLKPFRAEWGLQNGILIYLYDFQLCFSFPLAITTCTFCFIVLLQNVKMVFMTS